MDSRPLYSSVLTFNEWNELLVDTILKDFYSAFAISQPLPSNHDLP